MGANLGDPVTTLRRAAAELDAQGTVLRRSRIWRTDPVGGPPGQPDYLNAVVVFRPGAAHRDPHRLLSALHDIEARHGRRRRLRWAPRLLDLDLVALGDEVREEPGLALPHPRVMERAFVLVPLLEVAPTWHHPQSGVSAATALAGLDRSGVRPAGVGWRSR